MAASPTVVFARSMHMLAVSRGRPCHGGAVGMARGAPRKKTHPLSHCAIHPAGSLGSVGSVGPESGDTGGWGGVGAAMLVDGRLYRRPWGKNTDCTCCLWKERRRAEYGGGEGSELRSERLYGRESRSEH
jgi:hypothetical protein